VKFFVHGAYLMARAMWLGESLPSNRDLFLAFSMQAFNDADLNALTVSAVTTFASHEYNGPDYERQQIGSLAITKDGTAHTWNLRGAAADFGIIGPCSGSNQARYGLVYMGATASPSGDGSAIPLGVIDNPPTFPFNGNGSKRVRIKWENRGIFYGPNCEATGQAALTMGDSLYLAQNYI